MIWKINRPNILALVLFTLFCASVPVFAEPSGTNWPQFRGSSALGVAEGFPIRPRGMFRAKKTSFGRHPFRVYPTPHP